MRRLIGGPYSHWAVDQFAIRRVAKQILHCKLYGCAVGWGLLLVWERQKRQEGEAMV
jgi:hypothetical protein